MTWGKETGKNRGVENRFQASKVYLCFGLFIFVLSFRNTVQLVVNVADVNDNPPVFLHSHYEARLMEGSSEFESPLVIEARDADLNGKVIDFGSFLASEYALSIPLINNRSSKKYVFRKSII